METEEKLYKNSINGHVKSFSLETSSHLGKEWKETSKEDLTSVEEVPVKATESPKAAKQVSIIDSEPVSEPVIEPASEGVSDIDTVKL